MQGNAKSCKVDIKTCANSPTLSRSRWFVFSPFLSKKKPLIGVAPVSLKKNVQTVLALDHVMFPTPFPFWNCCKKTL